MYNTILLDFPIKRQIISPPNFDIDFDIVLSINKINRRVKTLMLAQQRKPDISIKTIATNSL